MSPIKILMIDHHAAFTASVVDFLTLYPELKVVAIAHDAEWGMLEAQVLGVDMILVDLELRGLSGLETIRRLRALHPTAGIIALSINEPSGRQQAALLAGADGFVSKADMPEDLLAALHRVGSSYGFIPTYSED